MSLDRAQRSVGLLEKRKLRAGEMTRRLQPVKARERLGRADRGLAAAVHELQHLHDELDVDHPAGTTLEVGRPGALLHAVPHPADLGNLGGGPFAFVGCGMHEPLGPGGRRRTAHYDPRLHEGLPLPDGGRTILGEVAGDVVERHRRRSAAAAGAEPGIHFIEPAVGAEGVEHLHRPLRKLREEVGVGRALDAPSRATTVEGDTVVVVEKDEVHVTGVVHLAAAELAHRQHHRLGSHTDCLPLPRHRLAEPLHEPLLLADHHHPQDRFWDGRERGGRLGHVLPAENVAHPNPQLLRGLEGLDDRLELNRPLAEFGERGIENGRRWQPWHHEAVEQFVDHAGIAHQQFGEEGA